MDWCEHCDTYLPIACQYSCPLKYKYLMMNLKLVEGCELKGWFQVQYTNKVVQIGGNYMVVLGWSFYGKIDSGLW